MKSKNNWLDIKKNYMLYLFLLPSFAYIVIFHYIPLYGIQIAFKNFTANLGIWGSPWVGLTHFKRFFESYHFWTLLKNTLVLSLYGLVAGFPIPIILALLLNYSPSNGLKKIVQTTTYAPHFISTVVMVGILMVFLSPRSGVINQFIKMLGGNSILFMGRADLFAGIYVWSGVWQTTGWSSIIYIAVLSNVDQEQHEAAIVDGANKLQRIWHIDLPAIVPTMVILLILNVGRILSVGFEKAFLMQTDANIAASEIISTYVYKIGILSAQYSYSTAIGLFNNIINVVMLVLVNKIADKLTGSSVW
ncbi:MAG: ABC transporter permease subunit [Treponema sp.]|nr:ABC transporter permease subunit [Treponema sp.]